LKSQISKKVSKTTFFSLPTILPRILPTIIFALFNKFIKNA